MKLLKPTYEYSKQITEYRDAFLHADEQPHGSSSYKILILSMNGLKSEYTRSGKKLQGNRVPSSQF